MISGSDPDHPWLTKQLVDGDEIHGAKIQLSNRTLDHLAIADDNHGHLVRLDVSGGQALEIRAGDLRTRRNGVRDRVVRQVVRDELLELARQVARGLEL